MSMLAFSENAEFEPVIAGRLRPRLRLAVHVDLPPDPVVAGEINAALLGLSDNRDAEERAIDYVVDRLLDELTW